MYRPAYATIPDSDRTYTVTVSNVPPGGDVNVTLFGANQFLAAVNFGLPANVTVTVGESSYEEMLQESQLSPFIISGLRVAASNAMQLQGVLSMLARSGNGQRCSYPLQMDNYFSAFQFQSNIIEINPYNVTITGQSQMQFTLLDLATVQFTFFVGKRLSVSDGLHNRSMISVANNRLPFAR